MKIYKYFDGIIFVTSLGIYFLDGSKDHYIIIKLTDFKKLLNKKRFGEPVLQESSLSSLLLLPEFSWINDKSVLIDEIINGQKKDLTPGVYVCGDTHSNIDYDKISMWNHKSNLSKDDILIVLGDWAGIIGINMKQRRKEEKLLRRWVREPFTLFVQLGNHENYKSILRLPIIEKFGGKVYEKKVYSYNRSTLEGIIYIMIRGEVYNIHGNTYFSMGGAKTFDPNPDYYWQQELPSDEEKSHALNTLTKFDFNVDFVITHTCPTSIAKELIAKSKAYGKCTKETSRLDFKLKEDPISTWFQDVLIDKHNIQFKHWFFGHWHIDSQLGKFSCHYNHLPKRIN